jgi:hypothetical protein
VLWYDHFVPATWQAQETEFTMTSITLSEILDDIRAAEDGLHKFERRYWLSSEQFYTLYSQGLLDDGDNAEDFSEWAGHYKLWQKRRQALERISDERLSTLRQQAQSAGLILRPAEPVLPVGS